MVVGQGHFREARSSIVYDNNLAVVCVCVCGGERVGGGGESRGGQRQTMSDNMSMFVVRVSKKNTMTSL